MLHEQLRNAWRARERAVPISPAMHFASEGLILGAGTRFVSYDDCEKKTSILFEFKSDYGGLLMFDSNARQSFLDQSLRQIAASGARPVAWIFANRQDAERTRELFKEAGKGREYITIVHVPWTTRGTR